MIQTNYSVVNPVTSSTTKDSSVSEGLSALAQKSPSLYSAVIRHIKFHAPAHAEQASATGGHAYATADPAHAERASRTGGHAYGVASGGTGNSKPSTSKVEYRLLPDSEIPESDASSKPKGLQLSTQPAYLDPSTLPPLTNSQKMLSNAMSGLVIFDRNGSINPDIYTGGTRNSSRTVRTSPAVTSAVVQQSVKTTSTAAVDVSA